MLAALIIVFREIIEAGLVVGIVLAATRGVPRRGLWVGYGILGGIAGACLVAAFASSISAAMQGAGQELFNFTILLIAVLMLAWHNVWMARHGREMAAHIKAVGEAVAAGHRSLVALSIVVGVAVLREGAAIELLLYGVDISGNDTAAMAQVVTSFTQMVWDTSNFISDGSVIGKVLHTLIGYTDRPTVMQLALYVTTLATIFPLMKLFGHSIATPQCETRLNPPD